MSLGCHGCHCALRVQQHPSGQSSCCHQAGSSPLPCVHCGVSGTCLILKHSREGLGIGNGARSPTTLPTETQQLKTVSSSSCPSPLLHTPQQWAPPKFSQLLKPAAKGTWHGTTKVRRWVRLLNCCSVEGCLLCTGYTKIKHFHLCLWRGHSFFCLLLGDGAINRPLQQQDTGPSLKP